MWLTDDELQELTGYRYPKRQRAWLRANGIPFFTNRWGRPRVLRTEIERAGSAGGGQGADDGPNLSVIRGKKAS